MSQRLPKFYMVRLQGGPFEPRRKISNLAKAMEVAFVMAQRHGKSATILQSLSKVEIVDGKPAWTEQTPDR